MYGQLPPGGHQKWQHGTDESVACYDESKMAEELTYFVHSEHIDRFDYSTPNAPKEISTVFDEEIQKIS